MLINQSQPMMEAIILCIYTGIGVIFLLCYKIYSLSRRINRLKVIEKELRFYSYYDSLSGTYNRNAFVQQVKALESDKGLALMLCDIDGLKLINDTLGHSAGDELIRVTADTLNAVCSSAGQVYRLGGDEYVVLFVNRISDADAAEFVKSVRQAVCKYNEGTRALPLSLSIGWAVAEDSQVGLTELMKIADGCMYQEKFACREKVRQSLIQVLKKYDK